MYTFCIFFLCGSSYAQIIDRKILFQGKVPVNDMSTDARDDAFRRAFEQVIIKITGQSSMVEGDKLKSLIQQANTYVEQYKYTSKKVTQANGEVVQQLNLTAQFDRPSVMRAISSTQLPIWGLQRPVTLIWLAIQTEQGQQIVSADLDSPLPKELKQAALKRGIPVLLPILDLQDISQISAQDVWDPKLPIIHKVSDRYGASAILVGHLNKDNQGQWQGDWLALVDKDSVSWQTTAATTEQVLDKAVGKLADGLASHFVVAGATHSSLQWVSIMVTQINDLTQYNKVKRYLSHLSIVNQLETLNIQPTAVSFRIQINGNEEMLQQMLDLDRRLSALPKATPPIPMANNQDQDRSSVPAGVDKDISNRTPIPQAENSAKNNNNLVFKWMG